MNDAPNLPQGHELRRGIRPGQALSAMRQLMADKEDTSQVFRIVQALSGNSYYRNFRRFAASPRGQTILTERADLFGTLSDRERLARCAPGTLGRAYIDLVYREGLTVQGLVEASGMTEFSDPAVKLYRHRLRDSHDLFHVVTDYGRDALGELCVLSFGNAQFYNHGITFIVAVGTPKLLAEHWQLPVARAAFEAWRLGRKAADLTTFYWERYLDRPLEEVRRDLNLQPPEVYVGVRDLSQRLEGEFHARQQGELQA